jgi:predicted nucleic acid-binding protein
MPRFLDTNVLLRYFANDDPIKAQAALTLLQRVERGDERVIVSPIVVFEVVFTLQRSYKMPKEAIRRLFWRVLSLRDVQLADKALMRDAFDLYVEQNIAFADAYHAVWLQRHNVTEVYSWDREFDRVNGITRIEP